MDEEIREGIARDTPPPDLGALLGGLLGGGGAEQSSDALRDGIGSVLSDPQMMAKLPAMIEMLRPMMGNKAETMPEKAEKTVLAPSAPSAEGKAQGACHDRRVALLRALRPYLNARRQEAIDYILRMDQMGKLFRGG